jgi:hypothetical protein
MDSDETLARVWAAIKAEPARVIRPKEPSEALAAATREVSSSNLDTMCSSCTAQPFVPRRVSVMICCRDQPPPIPSDKSAKPSS